MEVDPKEGPGDASRDSAHASVCSSGVVCLASLCLDLGPGSEALSGSEMRGRGL